MATISIPTEQIRDIILGSPKKCGCFGNFVYITNGVGVKYYTSSYYLQDVETFRDKTYEAQKLAYEHGLGPKPGDKIQFTDNDGTLCYGYITEAIPNVFANTHPHNIYDYYRNDDNHWYMYEDSQYYQDWKAMYDGLMKIGLRKIATDLHASNWGYNTEGKAVCIDFGIN